MPPGHRMPPPRPPVAGGVHVFTKCFFQSSSPLSTSIAKMLSETPATLAICFVPLAVVTFSTIRGGNSACIWRTSLSSLIFQSSFVSRTLDVVKIFSSFCQAVRCTFPPSVSQSALQEAEASASTQIVDRIRIFEPFYLELPPGAGARVGETISQAGHEGLIRFKDAPQLHFAKNSLIAGRARLVYDHR